jgi:MFS family permease
MPQDDNKDNLKSEVGAIEVQSSKELCLAFIPLATLAFAAALVSTTYSLAAANIASSLGLSSTETLWAAVATVLASTIIQPVCPLLCDCLGRLTSFWTSAAILTAGSLLGALARSSAVLILGRSLQGLGSGAAVAVTEIMVTETVPLHARGYWFALLSVAWAVGSITGPLIGGVLAGASPESWVSAPATQELLSAKVQTSGGFLP